ncbi:hypothetical protein VTO42DRAFT_1732 [Malbranchea cinnamomea]
MVIFGPEEPPKTFVLCFDGTGNKFSADSSDSNVLKIFRMLDRTKRNQFHYYQPGIGIYITDTDLTDTGMISKLKASYRKAKDVAVGTTFADHVLGGYQFLMRYYSPGDDIYFFGFSRGAYIARFLAEMLDYVGLLSAGNEELVQFAWNTFSKWQRRKGDTPEDRRKKRKVFHYMKAFRETFSRPVKPIRFMGLFDTVNSVPQFENAWMQRNKFPYTARSSAKVIRHAVAIDERRAKFRQDLISEVRHFKPTSHARHVPLPTKYRLWRWRKAGNTDKSHKVAIPRITIDESGSSQQKANGTTSSNGQTNTEQSQVSGCGEDERYRLPTRPRHSILSAPQLGPGAVDDNTSEARRAGLQFDERKLKQFECIEEVEEDMFPSGMAFSFLSQSGRGTSNSQLRGTEKAPAEDVAPYERPPVFHGEPHHAQQSASSLSYYSALHHSATSGRLHDCLQFDSGISAMSVLFWRMMEYLPFRRMDLQPDGSWRPIRWPLPCGEVRDIPDDAQIHTSAIKRMKNDPNYRPGNLILGGGGRGVRRAPKHVGIGEWVVVRDEGDPVREAFMRRRAWEKMTEAQNNQNRQNGENGQNGHNGHNGHHGQDGRN